MRYSVEGLTEYLNFIEPDAALRGQFQAVHSDLIEAFQRLFPPARPEVVLETCPGFNLTTALQFTVFDNHLKPKKNGKAGGVRWGGNCKAWTQERIDFTRRPAWEANVRLEPASDALVRAMKQHEGKVTYPISESTLGDLVELVTAKNAHGLFGIFRYQKPGDGTRYFEGHYAWADIDASTGQVRTMEVYTPSLYQSLPPFSDEVSGGGKLSGRAIGQSRASSLPELSDWATGGLDCHP